jgi:ribosomal protein S18 acetylase RimI-like enzyme
MAIEAPDERARRRLVNVLARAFRDNPMNVAIHGASPRRRLRANRAGLRALILDSGEHAIARVIRIDQQVVGGFVAIPPGLFPLPRPRIRRQLGCLLHQGARAMEQWSRVDFELGQFRTSLDHWYLAVLGVDPTHQGRGLGGRLLAELTRLAEERPAPIYLEADRAESVRFYRGRGFEDLAEHSVLGVRCICLGKGFSGAAPDVCDSVRVQS